MGIRDAYNRIALKLGLRDKTNSEKLDEIIQDTEIAFEALPNGQQNICRVLMGNIADPDLEEARYVFFSNMFEASLLYETHRQGVSSGADFSNSMQAPSVDRILKLIRDIRLDQTMGLEKDRGNIGQELGASRKAWYLSSCINSARMIEHIMNADNPETLDSFQNALDLVQQKSDGELIHFYDGSFENDQYSFRDLERKASKAFFDPNHEAIFDVSYEEGDSTLALNASL